MKTRKVNELLVDLDETRDHKEPALAVGTTTGAIAGILALVVYWFPDLLTEQQIGLIATVSAFVLPIATALLTRNKVWSPATVKEVVEESTDRAVEVTKMFANRKKDPLLDDEVVEVIE